MDKQHTWMRILQCLATIWFVCYLLWNIWAHKQPDALVRAVKANDYVTTKALLDKGADVNATSSNGQIALIAVFTNEQPNLRIAELLISKGANVNTLFTDVTQTY